MDKFKMLSGEELVIQGAKKVNSSLPELGLKDTVPNGSWLEQKQIQNSLEARRHIVEVERIEKSGLLSQAEWNEELNLAEVTKLVGGHWRFVGHNVGRHTYAYPEEALYLMECSCLQLKHNGVTVSIQQAYALLLKDNSSLIQYKVYAALSRLGYKVLRHTYIKTEETKNETNPSSSDEIYEGTEVKMEEGSIDEKPEIRSPSEIDPNGDCLSNDTETHENPDSTKDSFNAKVPENVMELSEDNIDRKTDRNIVSEKDVLEPMELCNGESSTVDNKENKVVDTENVHMDTENTGETLEISSSVNLCDGESKITDKSTVEESGIVNLCEERNDTIDKVSEGVDSCDEEGKTSNKDTVEVSECVDLCDDESQTTNKETIEVSEFVSNRCSAAIIQNKIDILNSRHFKPSYADVVHQCFDDNLPDFYQKQIVTVKAPEEKYIPRNVFLNNTAYVLNLENLRLKSVTPVPFSSQAYSISDEANAQHVRRIRSGYSNESAQSHFTPQFFPNMRFPQQTHYRQFNYWNHFNYNWNYQRPFFLGMPFRFQIFPRMQTMFRCFPTPSILLENSDTMRRTRKRKRNNPKKYHLESIKKLALKLKNLVACGNRQEENIQALRRLIQTYNVRYETRLELTEQLDVVENEIILDTIDLDDDEQPNSKKGKPEPNLYDENFKAVKQLSVRIKELEATNMLSARHRRAFSNVIKTFNKSYNADIYVNSNYEVIDRRHIVIASSSDSDCAVEEIQSTIEATPTLKSRKSKKLRNPFSIMKQLSEKQTSATNSLDLANESRQVDLKKKSEYSSHLKSMFSKYWLPNADDFGRAEVPLKTEIKNQMEHSEDFLYQFIKSHPGNFDNWLEAKIAYWQSCKETALKFETRSQSESHVGLDSIIKPEDCTDLRAVLKKLSIIKTNKDVLEECTYKIHFDVYCRDVPNFKKSKKPKPHFRVICIEESSSFPTGAELATFHSKYKDDVCIIFAVVGSSSILYLQVNPMDLPVYVPTSNLP